MAKSPSRPKTQPQLVQLEERSAPTQVLELGILLLPNNPFMGVANPDLTDNTPPVTSPSPEFLKTQGSKPLSSEDLAYPAPSGMAPSRYPYHPPTKAEENVPDTTLDNSNLATVADPLMKGILQDPMAGGLEKSSARQGQGSGSYPYNPQPEPSGGGGPIGGGVSLGSGDGGGMAPGGGGGDPAGPIYDPTLGSLSGSPSNSPQAVSSDGSSSSTGSSGQVLTQGAGNQAPSLPTIPKLAEGFANKPLSFELNEGQTDAQARFLARGQGYSLFLTNSGPVLTLAQPRETSPRDSTSQDSDTDRFDETISRDVLALTFEGSNPSPRIVGRDQLLKESNYFIGEDSSTWLTNVPNYGRVEMENVYAGIDVAYYGTQTGKLEYDFIVSPGADASQIQLNYQGAQSVRLDEEGHLRLSTAHGEVITQAPTIYQRDDSGAKQTISGSYNLTRDGKIGFTVGEYDSSRELVIDPVLDYSTYLGGSGNDYGNGIAVDSTGSTYVVGETYSSNFPTLNPFQGTLSGTSDVFVTKFGPLGDLLYSTYLGSSDIDRGNAIAVDAAGNAYITGYAIGSTYPTTTGAYDTSGSYDAFVTKLSPSGDSLLYSTYLGSSLATTPDIGYGIAVDEMGQAVVTGTTPSFMGNNFPTTTGAFQTTYGGGSSDAFVTKFNADGSDLIYSSYLGGSSSEIGYAVALDPEGYAYITGKTSSSNFPTTTMTYDTILGGSNDIFVTKVAIDGTSKEYSTYLGGSGDDFGRGIAVDIDGHAYITGYTAGSYPISGGFQPTYGSGTYDAVVTKLATDGKSLLYSSYLGGSGDDYGYAIALDPDNNVYLTGSTTSGSGFNTTHALYSSISGTSDAFVTKVNS
ncbi:MAG: SBBP repeat-containing protein, partial [Bdellovibrionales bacterium]